MSQLKNVCYWNFCNLQKLEAGAIEYNSGRVYLGVFGEDGEFIFCQKPVGTNSKGTFKESSTLKQSLKVNRKDKQTIAKDYIVCTFKAIVEDNCLQNVSVETLRLDVDKYLKKKP